MLLSLPGLDSEEEECMLKQLLQPDGCHLNQGKL